jgi:hypothetical protein
VPVNPFHAIAVIEQKNFASTPVNQQAAEQAVQRFEKLLTEILVKMDETIAAAAGKTVAVLSESVFGFRFDETFTGEKQRDVPGFTLKNLFVGEGVFVRHPTGEDAEFRHGKSSGQVKAFVLQGGGHGFHGAFTFGSGFSADYSGDAWHGLDFLMERNGFK